MKLQSRLIVVSFVGLVVMGGYGLYHRSPENLKYLAGVKEDFSIVANRLDYYTDTIKRTLGIASDESPPKETQSQDPASK